MQSLRDESAIEQVQDRVLDAARVLVRGHPPLNVLAPEGSVVVAGRAVAEEVPGGVDEGVHRIRVAYGLAEARGTRHVFPRRVPSERRIAPQLEIGVLRQEHRELVVWHGDLPAIRAMDDRDRRAPVPLAADEPVAQPVLDARSSASLVLEPRRDLRDGRRRGLPVEGPAVDHHAFVGDRLGHRLRVQVPTRRLDHHPHRDPVLPGEFEVTLIVRRDGHDRAGPVPHQHVRSHEARNPLPIHGVHGVHTERNAFLRVGLLVARH